MPKRQTSPEPKRPTISLLDGKRRLTAMRDKATALLAARPLSQQATETLANQTVEYLQQTFGEHTPHLYTFIGPMTYGGLGGYNEERDAKNLMQRRDALNSILDALETEIELSAPVESSMDDDDFWTRLHPLVVTVSRSLFETQHYADAVLASLRELNAKVKAYVKKSSNQEYDGADLMRRAFSPTNPIVRLGDLSTEDGKNIQQGYMEIFAGTMTAIRNPKAHSNLKIDADRAIHFLHLASLLHYIFDERL